MISFLRKHRQALIISVVIFFLGGIFVGLGGYMIAGSDTTQAVAVIGGEKIPYLAYRVRVNQYIDSLRQQGTEVTDPMIQQIKQDFLRDMIVNEILAQKADSLGLHISDRELALSIQQSQAFQTNGVFSQPLYFQMVRTALQSTPEEYEEQQRRSMLSAKLKQIMYRGAKIVGSEVREEYLRSGGSIVDFEKEQSQFVANLHQQRALDSINFYLRKLSNEVKIRTYLEERERGL